MAENTFKYRTSGVCSSYIYFDIDDNMCISNLSFEGGCPGNLQGIGKLCEGMNINKIIDTLAGIKCGKKNTSCPDQLSKALTKALEIIKGNKDEK